MHTETGQESGGYTSSWATFTSSSEVADSVEPWNECCSLDKEVSSVAEEHQHGECVAQNEFTKTGDEEQHTAEPHTRTKCCDTEATRATPVHWILLAMIMYCRCCGTH